MLTRSVRVYPGGVCAEMSEELYTLVLLLPSGPDPHAGGRAVPSTEQSLRSSRRSAANALL